MDGPPPRGGGTPSPRHTPRGESIRELAIAALQPGDVAAIKLSPRVQNRHIDYDTLELVGEDDTDSDATCFQFVEHGAFGLVTTLIIVCNVVCIAAEASDPSWKPPLFWIDQFMLCFYIFELFCRAAHLRWDFIFGPGEVVAWDCLDVVVVLAAIVDQWLLPLVPGDPGPNTARLLTALRLLRLLRVLKIVRIFLETDLSWAESPAFESFVGCVIVFNAGIFAFETDYQWSGWYYIEQVLLVIYAFELSFRMKRSGYGFFQCSHDDINWNILDSIIVWSSVGEQWVQPCLTIIVNLIEGTSKGVRKKGKPGGLGSLMTLMRLLRLMRILRLVKLVKFVTPLYVLVTGVLSAVQGVMWVLVLTLCVLYAMGIVATRLIAHGLVYADVDHVPPEVMHAFGTVPDSMFTLFRVMSGVVSTEESAALDELMSSSPCAKFALVFFMVTSSWTLLSILTAVVSENMLHSTDFFFGEMKLDQTKQERKEQRSQLGELFEELDLDHGGEVTAEELEDFLSDIKNASRAAKVTRLLPQDVSDVLESQVQHHGRGVHRDEFIASLIDASDPPTEKSLMRLEAHLVHTSREIQKGVQLLDSTVNGVSDAVAIGNREMEELKATARSLFDSYRAPEVPRATDVFGSGPRKSK